MHRLIHSAFAPRTRSCLLAGLALLACSIASPTQAQDWGDDDRDRDDRNQPYQDQGWETPDAPPAVDPYPRSAYDAPAVYDASSSRPGWSFRAGVGFTAAPESLHLNFEFPYSFDRWVSAGPSIQVGIDDDDTIVAPTLDVNVRLADLAGMGLARVKPYGIVGMGLAILDQDKRPGDNTDAGFLLNVGLGIEYEVSEHLYLGSQMKFNILPFQTLGQKFFYTWQVGGVRLAF
jgi:opacity protein-like surface antigen